MNFKLPLGVSARHCHVTREILDILYGKNFQLTVKKQIKQPGQFVSSERIKYITDKGEVTLSIIGPCRTYTQIELAKTDCRVLGINPPLRNSGDVKGTVGGKLIGPNGTVKIDEGALIVIRHCHISPITAEKFHIKDGDRVTLNIKGDRSASLYNVLCRVGSQHTDEVHLDTDEANGLDVDNDTIIEVITE